MTSTRRQGNILLGALKPNSGHFQESLSTYQSSFHDLLSNHEELVLIPGNSSHWGWLHLSPWMKSPAVLALLIVGIMTATVGLIYLFIYFKSIKPLAARTSRYSRNKSINHHHHHHKNADEESNSRLRSTHPFFRRT